MKKNCCQRKREQKSQNTGPCYEQEEDREGIMEYKKINVDKMRMMTMTITINKEMKLTMHNKEDRKRIRITIIIEIRGTLNNTEIITIESEENR